MRRLLITGASGYLAHRLVPLAGATGVEVIAVSRTRPDDATLAGARWLALDVSDATATQALVAELAPTAVIHAAAANPGAPEAAMVPVNVIGSEAVARAAAAAGARLVHVSSDTVFAGDAAPYADDATPDPVNLYGVTKAQAERRVAESHPGAAIVRTSLIYGTALIDRGTASFVERLDAGQPVRLFADVLRQPVWVDALAAGLLTLALQLTDQAGTLNLAGDEVQSRAEFGSRMLRHWRGDSAAGIELVNAAGRPGIPLDLRLRHDRAHALGLATPGVSEVLSCA